jgi:iron complex outermembrane receptor protein
VKRMGPGSVAWAILWAMVAVPATPADASPEPRPDPLASLMRMSLEELARVEVTSVSKIEQSLSSAPASIYVITREELLRSGVTSVPEALRLAPNMQVTQLTATEYSNGARGFGGAPQAQNFSNKILILIDGRSVYSPLFSGVAYDMQDVLFDDVDRIEVISGPGATLWGANAMHGVINIITRQAGETRGVLARLEGGAEERAAALRHGGEWGAVDYRVYVKGFERDASEFPDGTDAGDDWSKWQAGFRTDHALGEHGFTFQGDYQQAAQNFPGVPAVDFRGANLLGRWTHQGARVKTRVQAWLDRVDRQRPPSGIAFDINTWDFELQQSVELAGRHQVVWGLGRRQHDYHTENNVLAFVPDERTLRFTNLFIQDSIRLNPEFQLTAGVKFEENLYSGWSVLPDLRLSWAPTNSTLFWLAGSRAIRAPTPFDADVQEFVGGQLFLEGDPDFEPEAVTAFELGVRTRPDASVSLSASVFYNEYDDLRTIEITPVTLLPLRWGNLMEGSTYGVEAWADLQLASWWRLSPGFRALHKRLEFRPGSSQLLGLAQAGNDPSSAYQLKSSMDFGRFTVDALLRNVEDLPEPAFDEYTELSMRVAWRMSERLELAVKGFNLLNETHAEFAAPQGHAIRRNVMAEIRFSH